MKKVLDIDSDEVKAALNITDEQIEKRKAQKEEQIILDTDFKNKKLSKTCAKLAAMAQPHPKYRFRLNIAGAPDSFNSIFATQLLNPLLKIYQNKQLN